MSLRTRQFLDLVRAHVPGPPARILEVGCGSGELARALADDGFDVTAIDPRAPDGPIFRRVALEEFSDERGFDAIVASVSLHHIHDLGGALDRIAAFLPAAGPFVVEEWASERLVGATGRWYYEQRRTLAAAGRSECAVPEDFETWQSTTTSELADLHRSSTILDELEMRFVERMLEWRPYLYSRKLDAALETVERALIDEGAIAATGLWYVGERR